MNETLRIYRDTHGIPHIEAADQQELYRGLGKVHAADRGMQMILMRIIGQGRVSECLDSSEESLQIDIFFRRQRWYDVDSGFFDDLSETELSIMDAYCSGVNEVLEKKLPWELRLLRYTYEPWTRGDIIQISRMISYLTLTQSQDETEKLLVEMVKNGVEKQKLQEIFPGLLDELDIELIKKVTLPEPIIPPDLLWNLALPRMMASNNWVIAGSRTSSGRAILANDPHLEVNRLPNVWCEAVGKVEERYIMGATMPGICGFIIGRSPDLSWGATYAFTDSIDSWIEECRDGMYRSGDNWKSFGIRQETIRRKGKQSTEIIFYENDHGVLEGDPNKPGFYRATRWAAAESGKPSISVILKIWDAESVSEGMDLLGRMEGYWSWVLADGKGNIGFQMSGLVPKRREGANGFVPLPGWKEENNWQGFHDHKDLPRVLNPEKGYFATANQNLNAYGIVKPITMPMGSYRAERIAQLLEREEKFTADDVFKMHFDLYSLQAERFMKIAGPLLPDSPQGRILKNWDLCYYADSEGAYLFELFYKGLLLEIFGKNGFGEQIANFLSDETGLFVDFYQNFDTIMLSESSSWFGGRSRDDIYRKVLEETLQHQHQPQPLHRKRQIVLKNILFDGKLPRFLGFDAGPLTLIGSAATIHQGQIYRSANRTTTFAPSYRFVTDFNREECYTNLAGGPSDRRFSKWYTSDLRNWQQGIYKTVQPSPESKQVF